MVLPMMISVDLLHSDSVHNKFFFVFFFCFFFFSFFFFFFRELSTLGERVVMKKFVEDGNIWDGCPFMCHC